MENVTDITTNIIETINTIFKNLFSSIDSSLYEILDDLVFVNPDILNDKYFDKLFGTQTANGILLIANSLLIGFLLYYAAKFMMSNFTYNRIENPAQFIFKCIFYGICMNCSFFIIEQILNLNFSVTELIRGLGEDLFNKNICFETLISEINGNLSINENDLNIFTIDGLIKGTLTVSLLNLVFSYSLRYIMIKIRNLFSLLFIQILVAIVLLLLFSMDYTKGNLTNKFIYIGGIYALIKANSIVRELFGGLSTTIQSGISNLKLMNK